MNILRLMVRNDISAVNSYMVFASANDQLTYRIGYDELVDNISASLGASLVAGADTEIQFNNNGEFGADSNFVWDYNTQTLSITGAANATTFNGVALTAAGAATDYLDGSGNYSVPPITSASGSDTEIQFNTGGNFDSNPNLTWDGITLNANSFNSVALTAAGSATDFLNAQGNYSAINTGVNSVTGDGVGGTATDIVMTFPTATDLGLGNVDNTSDADKPVSTAQQTALDFKLNLAGGAVTGAVTSTSSWTGTTFNGVALSTAGSANSFLNEQGNYTLPVPGPAGADTQVQFNAAGVMGASAAMTWDGTTLNATQFNGIALTTAGAATNYLDETGNYSAPPAAGDETVFSEYLAGVTIDPSTTAEDSGSAPVLAQMTHTFTPDDATNAIEVFFSGSFENQGKGANGCQVGIFIDGTLQDETERETISGTSVEERGTLNTFWKGTLSAVPHTIDIRFWSHNGEVFGVNDQRNFWVKEVNEA